MATAASDVCHKGGDQQLHTLMKLSKRMWIDDQTPLGVHVLSVDPSIACVEFCDHLRLLHCLRACISSLLRDPKDSPLADDPKSARFGSSPCRAPLHFPSILTFSILLLALLLIVHTICPSSSHDFLRS